MFKIGDIVICVRLGSLGGIERDSDIGVHLKIGKRYVVIDTNIKISHGGDYHTNVILVDINNKEKRWCDIRRFISLPEYRKLKLKKICSKLET